MLDAIKLSFIKTGNFTRNPFRKVQNQRALGFLLLGALFALAFALQWCAIFCHAYSAYTLPMLDWPYPFCSPSAMGLPVILSPSLLPLVLEKLGLYFKAITKVEKVMRVVAGLTLSSRLAFTNIIYFQLVWGKSR